MVSFATFSLMCAYFLVVTSAFTIKTDHSKHGDLASLHARDKRSPMPFKNKGGRDTIIVNEYYGGGSENQRSKPLPPPPVRDDDEEYDIFEEPLDFLGKKLKLDKLPKPHWEIEKLEIPLPKLILPPIKPLKPLKIKDKGHEFGFGLQIWKTKNPKTHYYSDEDDEDLPQSGCYSKY